MLLLKYALTIVVAAFVVILFTFAWLVVRTRGSWGLSSGTAIDVTLASAMTVHSLLYWLFVLGIVACLVWLSRRCLF
jgi:hypothetical protein